MKRYLWLIVVWLLVTAAVTGCSASALFGNAAAAPAVAPATQTSDPAASTAAPPPGTLAALEGTLEQIYTGVNPSVVNIQVVQQQQVTLPNIPQLPNIPGFPFFGTPQTPQGPQQFYSQGQGSGFVWDQQGHIVTNNHVVDGADKITVTFYDGTSVPGTVVGTDPDSDLAVVKVDMPADQLHPVQLADSAQVKVGQLAIAIGNPFGLQGTMTEGIISAMGRSLPSQAGATQGGTYTIPDVIQTDAPINPGNSGGVLLNAEGQVIGVTSAIDSPVRANAGIGFAIPSDIVQEVVPALIQNGQYEHPWVGLSGTSLTPDLAQAMGLPADQRGALVVSVLSGSPAEKAGLQGSSREATINGQSVPVGGDLIVAIDGQPVKSFDDLVTYLARSTKVGQTVTLTVLRDGQQVTLDVTLAARPTSQTTQPAVTQQRSSAKPAWLGIQGATLTPDIDQAMNLSSEQQGVLVESVQANSPADEVGLRGSFKAVDLQGQQILVGGDVITAVDGQPMTQIEDLVAFVQQANPGQKVTLTVLRDGQQIELSVTLGTRPNTVPGSN